MYPLYLTYIYIYICTLISETKDMKERPSIFIYVICMLIIKLYFDKNMNVNEIVLRIGLYVFLIAIWTYLCQMIIY